MARRRHIAPLRDEGSERLTIVRTERARLAKPIMESNEESESALAFARRWVRRSSEPAAWSNLAAVYATKQPPDLKRARRWYQELMDARWAVVHLGSDGCGLRVFRSDRWPAA